MTNKITGNHSSGHLQL